MNKPIGVESMYYKSRKEDENRFLMARKGHLFLAPYQCEKKLVRISKWATAKETKHRGQAHVQLVAQG